MFRIAMLTSPFHSLVALITLFSSGIARSAPRERDVWDSMVDDGQRYGYVHTVVTRLPDGNFLFDVETRLLMEFLGEKHDMSSRTEYVVTKEYRLVRTEMTGMRTSGPVRASGKVVDGKLILSTEQAGVEQNRTVDLPEEAIAGVCLDDWLRDQPPDTQTARVLMIEDQSFDLVQNTLTCDRRDASGSEWSFRLGGQFGRGRRSYDANGNLRELVHEVPHVRMQRCPAEQARDVEYVTLGGRDALMFPMDKNIIAPDRLTHLSIQLSWKDVSFEELDLEDGRQSIVEASDEDGSRRALVTIKTPDLRGCDALFPVTGGHHESALSETMFIKPHDKAIVATARRIVEGKRTALEAVKAISEFVHGHIEPTVILETLSGPEVLESKVGKCAEYATLFASLARSVGIPTRMVLGERMVSGFWIGHGWNEAFVGRWVTVDANFNEVGASFGLLKLMHSDSLLGTQTVRWTIGDSLEISIVDFDLQPSSLNNKYTTGIKDHTYTNVDLACRVTTPGKTWSIEDLSQPGHVTVRFKTSDNAGVEATFVGFPVPPGTKPGAFFAARTAQIRNHLSDVELEENEAYDINGAEGVLVRHRGTATVESRKLTILLTEIFLAQGSHGYLFQFSSAAEAHARGIEDFKELVAGFEYLGVDGGEGAADTTSMRGDG